MDRLLREQVLLQRRIGRPFGLECPAQLSDLLTQFEPLVFASFALFCEPRHLHLALVPLLREVFRQRVDALPELRNGDGARAVGHLNDLRPALRPLRLWRIGLRAGFDLRLRPRLLCLQLEPGFLCCRWSCRPPRACCSRHCRRSNNLWRLCLNHNNRNVFYRLRRLRRRANRSSDSGGSCRLFIPCIE
jgi:hypothetical protein